MANVINGTSTGSGGLITSGDDSGILNIQTNETTAITVDASQVVGVGVTPKSTLTATTRSFQLPFALGLTSFTGSLDTYLHSNLYPSSLASGWANNATGGGNLFRMSGGAFYWYQAASGVADANSSLTQAMTLDASGNLLVGTTSGTQTLRVVGSKNGDYVGYLANSHGSPFGLDIVYSGASPNNTTNRFIDCEDTTTARFQVRSNGGIANYSANNVNLSDRREKTNFTPAKSYLDVICAIPVQTFNYVDQNLEEDDGLTLGVVAQDVQAVAPELVSESDLGTKEEPKMRLSIYQTDLQYALMKCIQEQQAIIETLTQRITALEGA